MINPQHLQITFWLAAGFVIVYTLGQHWHVPYRNLLRSVGLAGAGLMIIGWYFSACPSVATGFAFRLLLVTIVIKFGIWLFFRIWYQDHDPQDSATDHGSQKEASEIDPLAYEKNIQATRDNRLGRRAAGFEQTDAERQADKIQQHLRS